MIMNLMNIWNKPGFIMRESNVKQMIIVQSHYMMVPITEWKIGMIIRTMPKKIDQHICFIINMDIGI